MIWQIKLAIIVGLVLGSNFLTYKYMDNSCKVEKLESTTEAHEMSNLASQETARLANKIVGKKQQLEQQAKIDDIRLKETIETTDPVCKLSDDGLRILQDAINRANSTGSD